MSTEKPQLPHFIRRPLLGAAAGIVVFLMGFSIWAAFAPLATTVTLNGTLRSSQATYEIQHPYGGLVSEIMIDVYEQVEAGQLLLQLDTALERETLAAQEATRDRLLRENTDVLTLLNGGQVRAASELSSMFVRQQQVALQVKAAQENNGFLEQKISALRSKISLSEQQLAQMRERADRYGALSAQGFARLSDTEHLEEQILIVRGEVETDRATVIDLRGQLQRNAQQQELAQIAFEHELTTRRERNLAQLEQIEASILDLQDRIHRAEVRAPTSGVIASLPIAAEHMMATRGATLLTLAKPLKQAQVTFDVPVKYIDQIGPDMSARLIIPSLPARKMPKIDLRIEAISPRATSSEAGVPPSFAGLALVPLDTLDQLNQEALIGTLSEDMPVTLIVNIRETTFATYLLAPLVNSFSKALQD